MYLKTKEKRALVKNAHFEYLKEKYPDTLIEEYEGYTFLTYSNSNRYFLEIYRGTAGRPFYNYYHTNEASRSNKIEESKKSIDIQNKYKEERKAELKTKKYLTQSAIVASRIRELLKAKHPNIKFSVRSSNFAGGNSVDVSYTDFLPAKEIESLIGHFEAGNFDGMTDYYSYYDDVHEVNEAGEIKTLPRTKYLSVDRNVSDNVRETAKEYIKQRYELNEDRLDWLDNAVHRLTYNMDLSNGFDKKYADEYPYGIFDR